jgi:DNA helicase-2/ATP-dependent DNA helicase PcrA
MHSCAPQSRDALARVLDPSQRAAATGMAEAQLVLAGPGTGKTTTLTGRFVHLVRQGIDPRRILALTFTRKAAEEMQARIVRVLGLDSGRDLTVATFHGFALRHLRRDPTGASLPAGFRLWDTPQQRHVFNSRRMWWNEETDILDIIAAAKERLLDAAGFAAQSDPSDAMRAEAARFFQVYEQAQRAAGALDFADMVPLLVAAMDRDRGYAAQMTGAFDHLLVDEYQDVNPGQVALIRRFVQAGVRLWAVGDDDQTLYAFRAADVRFILDFEREHPRAQVHVLEHNYRSAAEIVAAAGRLIAHNRARREKSYRAVTSEPGMIVIRGYRTAETEARQTAGAIVRLLDDGFQPRQIAVLYRTGSVGLALQPALQERRIKYELRGAADLWQSVAARLMLGALIYLREGASPAAMSRLGSGMRADIVRDQLDQDAKRMPPFPQACRLARDVVAAAVPGRMAERSRDEWAAVVEAVFMLASSCASVEELETRIAEQSTTRREVPEDAVVLSTIHSAKGLEWDAVFIVGMEEGVIPHAGNEDREEERRVAYVGITRARRILSLTYAARRFGPEARPSPFLHELNGGERRLLVWTGPQAQGSDARLPLLSDRERRRLKDGLRPPAPPQPQGPAHRPASAPRVRTLPTRQGHAWSAAEDARLRSRFLAGDAPAALAKAHERTRGAIRSRLVKLGLLHES